MRQALLLGAEECMLMLMTIILILFQITGKYFSEMHHSYSISNNLVI